MPQTIMMVLIKLFVWFSHLCLTIELFIANKPAHVQQTMSLSLV